MGPLSFPAGSSAAVSIVCGIPEGDFLDSTALPVKPEKISVTVKGLKRDKVLNTRTGKKDEKWTLILEEWPQFPVVLGAKTNKKFLLRTLGPDPKQWVGKKVNIHNDAEVTAFGKVTGGIRFCL